MDEKEPRPKTPLERIREKQIVLRDRLARSYQDKIELPQGDLACVMESLKEANEIGTNMPNREDARAIEEFTRWWTDPLARMHIKNPYVLHLKDKSQKKSIISWIFRK